MAPSPARITARSSTLRNSRTLPGQLCRSSASITAGGDLRDAAIVLAIQVAQQRFRDRRDIVLALAQRRQVNVEDVQAVVEILAQMAAA